jgi:hypothetical protein
LPLENQLKSVELDEDQAYKHLTYEATPQNAER